MDIQPDAIGIVTEALQGTGVNLVASCSIETYDRRAPRGYQSRDLMPRARGVIVVGSAGGELWGTVRSAAPSLWDSDHPLDTHVAELLHRADIALAYGRVGSRRFDARADAPVAERLDFRALGELTGLGAMGPFGLLIHPVHGPWWALRGAWLVDVELRDPVARSAPWPCDGCYAPCLGSTPSEGILQASALVRSRCVVGQGSRYGEEQLAYHYDREATLARLRAGAPVRGGS